MSSEIKYLDIGGVPHKVIDGQLWKLESNKTRMVINQYELDRRDLFKKECAAFDALPFYKKWFEINPIFGFCFGSMCYEELLPPEWVRIDE